MKLSIIIPTLYQDMYYSQLMFNLRELKYLNKKNIEIITIEDKLVNEAWNEWVEKAQWDYVLIINDDIVIEEWTIETMMAMLKHHKVACPYFSTKEDEETIYTNNGDNIVGFCFMIKREDLDKCFPIPEDLKIWYGDNWIYNRLDKDIWWWGKIHHRESKTLLSDEHRARVDKLIERDKHARATHFSLLFK